MKIEQSMKLFLKELSNNLSAKTFQRYEYVLHLFYNYLENYGELSYEENKAGNIILTADTKEMNEGHISDFLEWFLIKKVIGPVWMNTSAPGIIQKYIKWLHKNGLLAEGIIDDVIKITKKAAKDLPRVEKAASLLYELCIENRGKFSLDNFKYEDYMEGYGEIIGIEEDNLYLNYDDEKIGPIHITKEIAGYLKEGDIVNLVVRRKGNLWYPLEVGNVYPGVGWE